jgi:hypothetical protein
LPDIEAARIATSKTGRIIRYPGACPRIEVVARESHFEVIFED